MPVLDNPKHERFYVYALVDSRDGLPFYVGKGCGNRRFVHMKLWKSGKEPNARKAAKISEIVEAGANVIAAVLSDRLCEEEAFRIERLQIAEIGLKNLTNLSRGELSEKERASLMAKEALSHIVPFSTFIAKRRTAAELALYRSIVDDLREFALAA